MNLCVIRGLVLKVDFNIINTFKIPIAFAHGKSLKQGNCGSVRKRADLCGVDCGHCYLSMCVVWWLDAKNVIKEVKDGLYLLKSEVPIQIDRHFL